MHCEATHAAFLFSLQPFHIIQIWKPQLDQKYHLLLQVHGANVRIDAGAHPHPVDVLTPFSREKSFVGRIQNKVEADEAAPQVKCVWMLAHYLHCMSTPPLLTLPPPLKQFRGLEMSRICLLSTLLTGFDLASIWAGRGHICKELCRGDLFISHLGVWRGLAPGTKWQGGL